MDTEALLKEGEALVEGKQFKRAISLFTKVITKAPQHAPAYCHRAEAYYALMHERMKAPCDADKYHDFEVKVRSRKELALCMKDLNAALRIAPDYAKAHFGKGAIEHEMGLYQEALRSFTTAIRLEGGVAEYYYRRAATYEALADDERALSDLDTLLEIDPMYADAYLARGVIFSSQERHAEAVREIDKAIELHPDTATYHNHRAMAISMPAYDTMDAEAFEAARESLTEAIRLDPRNAEPYLNRSILNGLLDDSAAELADLDMAIRLDTDFTAAYRQRFECLSQSGQKERAARDWAQYCSRAKKAARIAVEVKGNYCPN